MVLRTIRHEQAGSDEQGDAPLYQFKRTTPFATDTLSNQGKGNPFARTGMSRCAFRPSDDATTFPHLIPANAMAVVCLRDLARLLTETGLAPKLADEARGLADQIDAGLKAHALVMHKTCGTIWAYEVDGFGGRVLMDDANVPGLLSLPYLGFCDAADPVNRATRAFALSPSNPYYYNGPAGEGIGGPHIRPGWVWPMSVIMRAVTSTDDGEILACLRQLKHTHAGTGFMHESHRVEDANRFTRSWFAWANTLFDELVLQLSRESRTCWPSGWDDGREVR